MMGDPALPGELTEKASVTQSPSAPVLTMEVEAAVSEAVPSTASAISKV